jgi:hypothetical protein
MRAFRHLGILLCLAFAFAIGQQASLLHALGHATEQLQHKGDGKVPKLACEQCALSASSGGMPAAGMPPVAMVEGDVAVQSRPLTLVAARRVAVFRSRAPPVLL